MNRSRTLTLLLSFVLFLPLVSAEQSPKPQAVPMNPGPLGFAGYITLVPIDDRPAVGQFAQMVGAIADHKVTMPPREMLGRYKTPGDTFKIEQWLRSQDYSKVDALIVSIDMLAYGGPTRYKRQSVSFDEARKRLDFLRWFKSKNPRVPVYAFSTVQYAWPQVGVERNLELNLALLDLVKAGIIDELILLEDDECGPDIHRQDHAVLEARLKHLAIESKVQIYNGADEGSTTLVGRAILDKFASRLRVAVIYSSVKSKPAIAPDGNCPLEFIVENQIRAAGGIPVGEYDKPDVLIFVNAPGTSSEEFDLFLKKLIKELRETRYIALADVSFPPPQPHLGRADERIIAALKREGLLDKLAGYAARNTAGNTLGTVIPQASMRIFFKTKLNDSVERAARTEAAHFEFLLHRFSNDYLYHNIVQQEVKDRLLEGLKNNDGVRFPVGNKYEQINREAGEKMRAQIEKFFADSFQHKPYTLAYYNNVKRTITLNGLKDWNIYLLWPRGFEIAIEYKLDYSPN